MLAVCLVLRLEVGCVLVLSRRRCVSMAVAWLLWDLGRLPAKETHTRGFSLNSKTLMYVTLLEKHLQGNVEPKVLTGRNSHLETWCELQPGKQHWDSDYSTTAFSQDGGLRAGPQDSQET